MIYVTGDTHGDIEEFKERMQDKNLDSQDTLIICGDFGFDWDADTIKKWQEFDHKYTILFCDGNHENYDILNSLDEVGMYGDTVGVFGNNTFRLLTGHLYNIDGRKFLVYGGASCTPTDKYWRLDPDCIAKWGKLWWEEEVPDPECYDLAVDSLKKVDYKFDYLISHTCAPELKGSVLNSYKVDFYDPVEDTIRDLQLLIKENNGEYKKHFFGHFHVNKECGKECCLFEKVVEV